MCVESLTKLVMLQVFLGEGAVGDQKEMVNLWRLSKLLDDLSGKLTSTVVFTHPSSGHPTCLSSEADGSIPGIINGLIVERRIECFANSASEMDFDRKVSDRISEWIFAWYIGTGAETKLMSARGNQF
jgi:hypothetical protein